MMHGIRYYKRILIVVIAGLGSIQVAAAAEEGTITAFSAWQSDGESFQTGASEVTFIGALGGQLYIDTERGPIASGTMHCPATMTFGTADSKLRGEGHCTITADDGALVFATISCVGVRLVGCDGTFKLTGGTGKFAGITGGGPIIIRSEFRNFTITSYGTAKEQSKGIIQLRQLQYKIP
jgi:hypothetical protein